MKLPKRAFNSPLIAFANFENGIHVNLIRLSNPYANGAKYAVHDTSTVNGSGMFKTIESASKRYCTTFMAIPENPLNAGITGNATEHEKQFI